MLIAVVATLLGVVIGAWIGRGPRGRPVYIAPVGTDAPTSTVSGSVLN